ncbi:hypothetical protein BHF71_05305 [Vulcanibacillus modesticaldus]|uniref:4-amino-4-deoxychorismate lyase n=1 Tax=Vulcanibacillus modesticaldus TaxID=337097 RepID=A0A1D2YXC8_9BACI|nr:aminodeoxychorismate lyase [Vulcanibacillus modesticaldus]OEG00318.1 hypothetical protein BHF71_05305 [Vulcanibacillus modesticaldus]
MKWILNEQIVEEDQLSISVKDHGFLYGVGLFETFRVYDGTPFLFQEHIKRLKEGLSLIGIESKIDQNKMSQDLNRLLEINNLNDAYVRVTVTAGTAPLGLPNQKYDKPTILWQIKPLPPFSDEPSMGKNAIILKTPRNLAETRIRLKSINFLNNVIAKHEIIDLENYEGIFLTHDGYVAEGIVSNIFFVKQGKVYTPSLDAGILNGITRQQIISICEQNNISLMEGLFSPETLIEADEIFITNSIQEVVPILKLNEREYFFDMNTLTYSIIKAYKDSIKQTIINNKGSE